MESSTKTAEPATSTGTGASGAHSSSTSEPLNTKSAPAPQTHLSSAQNIFSGRPTTGLMCNNLRANPFSVSDNTGSSGILAKPKFSLKPSSFSATGDAPNASEQAPEESSTSKINPPEPAASNPFLRPAKLSYDIDDNNITDEKQTTEQSSEKVTDTTSNGSDDSKKTKHTAEDSTAEVKSDSATTSTHQPILAASTLTSHISRASQSSFVFGEALDSRVTNVAKENGTNGHSSTEEAQKPKMLTLEEAADEYKKQQESGPLLPEVETFTGEEGESNVLQISCKLFLFQDESKTWAERGRGCLRLNDDTEGAHSRLVMRTAGIHRVILNTNIWPAMVCERANLKSIRITGTESEQIHVYLITGSPADIDHLHNAVTYRIQRLKQNSISDTTSPNNASAKRKVEAADETTPKKQRAEEGQQAEGKQQAEEGKAAE